MARLPADPFWMVMGLNQGPPRAQHGTREKAVSEMQRLARANPGVVYVLLEAVGAAVKDDLKTVVFGSRERGYLDNTSRADDDIPF